MRIAARHSDLAQIQARHVGEVLKKAYPQLEIEWQFRATLGDQNLLQPLWQSEGRGLFTQDFRQDLLDGRIDMVVHSWKDLPIELGAPTEIAATLEREDPRDVLLIKREVVQEWPEVLQILTSSPRRMYNLSGFLPKVLPKFSSQLEFEVVRGNVPTRLRKLMSTDAHGLIVAKAALDRLLSAKWQDYQEGQTTVRTVISACEWMVLPLTANPGAAAQGALAIEINKKRRDLKSMLQAINHVPTFRVVEREREILQSYGGGCHQKIGVAVFSREYGDIEIITGLSEAGEVLNSINLVRSPTRWPKAQNLNQLYSPNVNKKNILFNREKLTVKMPANDFWISRAEAWPDDWVKPASSIAWTSGIGSWQKLAGMGIWVNGCSESFGENNATEKLELIADRSLNWLKLTHIQAQTATDKNVLGTYRLHENQNEEIPQSAHYFYWTSYSSFKRALELKPDIINGYHACGPGHTFDLLKNNIKPERLRIYLSYHDWKKEVLA